MGAYRNASTNSSGRSGARNFTPWLAASAVDCFHLSFSSITVYDSLDFSPFYCTKYLTRITFVLAMRGLSRHMVRITDESFYSCCI